MSDVGGVRRFVLPDLGEGLTEAVVVAWRVAAGDVVALNQVLAEVETEKAVVELPSPFAGTVVALLAEPGASVAVGAPLVAVDTGAPVPVAAPERVPTLVGYGPSEAPPSRRRRRTRHEGVPAPTDAPRARPLAAPPVRFMARQHGVDLREVAGHGPGGLITREDLAAHLATAAATAGDRATGPGPRETRTALQGVPRRMAEAMARSVAAAPQACVFVSVDATPTVELVTRLRRHPRFEGVKLTVSAVVARAVVLSLRDHPALNASLDEASREVVTKHYVNLGVAVAAPSGLLVPNVKEAQTLSLHDLAGALEELAARARAGRATPGELTGGTFTVTNVGVFGVDGGVPILNPGEAGILALGAVRPRPWEHDGAVALRDVTTLSLAFDHRLVDGRQASSFLGAVGDVLHDPESLVALA